MSSISIPVKVFQMDDSEYYRLKLPNPTHVLLGVIDNHLRFYYLDGMRRVVLRPSDLFSLWRHENPAYALGDARRYSYLSLGKFRSVERVYTFSPQAHVYFANDLERTAVLGGID